MNEPQNDIALIGLGTMGSNLVLNMADNGFSVAAFNRTTSVTEDFARMLQPSQHVRPCYSLEELLGSLKPPRRVMLMVSAGRAVDAVLAQLDPLLQPGDIIIDGGNSHFVDTDRRSAALGARGIAYLGVGISGGEVGARRGPSMMPGGPAEAYEAVRPIFESVAAKADGSPCVAYLGPGSTGHYVKMVHNGIEYGLMQLIAESYALLKQGLGLGNDQLADIYAEWQAGELESYLIEITAAIFRHRDDATGGFLIDVILGEAAQLGTGMWTSQSAMDLHVPVPNIDIAVSMRNLSALEDERAAVRHAGRGEAPTEAGGGWSEEKGAEGAGEKLLRAAGSEPSPAGAGAHTTPQAAITGERPAGVAVTPGAPTPATERRAAGLSVEFVRDALLAGMIITYAQGFAQLQHASTALKYDLALRDVASIWRGGCIIRSVLLRDFRATFERQPHLSNLLLDGELSRRVVDRREGLVAAVEAGIRARIPVPAISTALSYLDAYITDWLPTNLVQAQRDYFGAHTYRRTDREGVFHTEWAS
jgi:6-phosphogluconate dehydrogenase